MNKNHQRKKNTDLQFLRNIETYMSLRHTNQKQVLCSYFPNQPSEKSQNNY